MKLTRHVNEWSFENWEFVGQQIERREFEEEHGDDPDEYFDHDRYYPMMNYCYGLDLEPSEKDIKKVHEQTNCTVVRDKATGDYYLALTGGGMDLSQCIALAYIIIENRVPIELAMETYVQSPLSQSGEKYEKVLKECKKALSQRQNSHRLRKINSALKDRTEHTVTFKFEGEWTEERTIVDGEEIVLDEKEHFIRDTIEAECTCGETFESGDAALDHLQEEND